MRAVREGGNERTVHQLARQSPARRHSTSHPCCCGFRGGKGSGSGIARPRLQLTVPVRLGNVHASGRCSLGSRCARPNRDTSLTVQSPSRVLVCSPPRRLHQRLIEGHPGQQPRYDAKSSPCSPAVSPCPDKHRAYCNSAMKQARHAPALPLTSNLGAGSTLHVEILTPHHHHHHHLNLALILQSPSASARRQQRLHVRGTEGLTHPD